MSALNPQQGSPRHILVVANETVDSAALREAILASAVGASIRVTVVAPALNSRLRFWMTDDARARTQAEARLATCLEGLRGAGIAAEGQIGDADPFLAIRDAMHILHVDEMIIATHPEGRSNWLERGLLDRVQIAYPHQPVRHVVVYTTDDSGASDRRGNAAGMTA